MKKKFTVVPALEVTDRNKKAECPWLANQCQISV